MLDGQLIYSFPVEIDKDETIIRQELSDLISTHDFVTMYGVVVKGRIVVFDFTLDIKDQINLDDNACEFIKYKLKTRTKPFEYENELKFFTSLISCKIVFPGKYKSLINNLYKLNP